MVCLLIGSVIVAHRDRNAVPWLPRRPLPMGIHARDATCALKPEFSGNVHVCQLGTEPQDHSIFAIHRSCNGYCFCFLRMQRRPLNRVNWIFIKLGMEEIGLYPSMCSYIIALYSTPRARVQVNGSPSEAFPIGNVTQQGCPLSLLNFAFALKPFIRNIKQNPDSKGIQVAKQHHKISTYTDDSVFLLRNLITTLPNFICEFSLFGQVSNFYINCQKS